MESKEEQKIDDPANIQNKVGPNRATRRKMQKGIHHNVFTKKYKSKKNLDAAWKMFLGDTEYNALKKEIKKQTKEIKEAALLEKQKKKQL